MQKNLFKYAKNLIALVGFSGLLISCSKKDLVVDVPYPAQSIGIAQAAVATVGPGANGVYSVTSNIEGQAYRFVTDVPAGKLIVPLGIIRSGVDISGSIDAAIAVTTDTIAKLITIGKLPAGTEILSPSAYTLPTSVSLADGATNADFLLATNLNFLIANITKKYAVAVSISSAKSGVVKSALSTAVIFIDPAQVLLPVANFSNSVDNLSKTASFINLSANGKTYSWSFGDGSPVETKASPDHKYAASGTYTVTLTATGITGAPTVKTTNIVIL